MRALRQQKREEGQTGGVLTQEAREKFRAMKEKRQEREAPTTFDFGRPAVPSPDRKEEPAQMNVEKGRRARDLAEKSKAQRQGKDIRNPRPTV